MVDHSRDVKTGHVDSLANVSFHRADILAPSFPSAVATAIANAIERGSGGGGGGGGSGGAVLPGPEVPAATGSGRRGGRRKLAAARARQAEQEGLARAAALEPSSASSRTEASPAVQSADGGGGAGGAGGAEGAGDEGGAAAGCRSASALAGAAGWPCIALGMHLCGPLAHAAVELFNESDEIRALLLVPCCLNKRSDGALKLRARALGIDPCAAPAAAPPPAAPPPAAAALPALAPGPAAPGPTRVRAAARYVAKVQQLCAELAPRGGSVKVKRDEHMRTRRLGGAESEGSDDCKNAIIVAAPQLEGGEEPSGGAPSPPLPPVGHAIFLPHHLPDADAEGAAEAAGAPSAEGA